MLCLYNNADRHRRIFAGRHATNAHLGEITARRCAPGRQFVHIFVWEGRGRAAGGGRRLRAGAGPGPGGGGLRAAGPGPGGGRAAAGCGQRRLPTDGDADGGRTRPTDRSDRLMGAAAGCGWVGLRLLAGGGLRAAPAAVADGRRRTAGVLAGRQVIVVLTPPTACPRCTRAYEIWQ